MSKAFGLNETAAPHRVACKKTSTALALIIAGLLLLEYLFCAHRGQKGVRQVAEESIET